MMNLQVSAIGRMLLIAIVGLACGCGSSSATPPLGMVTGTVKLDGKPVEGLAVIFMPDTGRSSTGVTDKDGVFNLSFDDQHPGAVVGKHKVRITRNIEQDMAAGRPLGEQLPVQYNTETILEKDVAAGENKVEFDLKSSI